MPKFILDPCVEDELWGIWYFIAQDNPDAATRVIEAAYETFPNACGQSRSWQAATISESQTPRCPFLAYFRF
jgi:plasmid stabilization system protein ParE